MTNDSFADFLITDPLASPGVVETVPEGIEMIDLDDVPYRAEPQVRCAFCPQRQWHNDGYFAILSNGQRAPCGNCCAAHLDSVKKRTIDGSRARLKRERDKWSRARALAAGLDDVAEILEFADGIISATAAAVYVLPEVLSEEACDDMAAYGVQGLNFLDRCRLGGCSARLDFARKTINRIRRLDGITEKEQEHLMASRAEAINEVLAAVAYVHACAAFFNLTNITAIEEWTQTRGWKFGVLQFKVKGKHLHLKGPGAWKNIGLPEIVLPPVVLTLTERSCETV